MADLVQETYDYIIVGSGAGGGPLAANLAKAGSKVLLLEAGSRAEPSSYAVPAFHPVATEEDSLKWDFFVRHYEDEERSRRDDKFVKEEDGVLYPRAGTLGGCTAHHAMIVVYPHNSDWDSIVELTGDESWASGKMRRYFERLEQNKYRKIKRFLYRLTGFNSSRHGFDGWLPTDIPSPALALDSPRLLRLIIKGVLRAEPEIAGGFFGLLTRLVLWIVTLGDPNDWKQVCRSGRGVRFAPLSTLNGVRRGTRELIDETQRQHPDRLHVKLNCLVTSIVFDPDSDENRAIGVKYLEGDGLYAASAQPKPGDEPAPEFEVRCNREVILCAGAFNTPQLLMLSGIGPQEELAKHGIPLRKHRPGVGRNLQDRYEVGVVSKMKERFALLEGALFKAPGPGEEPGPLYKEWLEGEGPYTTNAAVITVIKKSDPSRPEPDLFCFGLIGYFRGYFPGYSKLGFRQPYFTWAVLKAHTENDAGWVKLRSANPRERPLINFKYFDEGSDAEERDLKAVVEGVKFVRKLNASYDDLIETEVVPGAGVAEHEEIADFVKNNAWGHHASCTCRIGVPSDMKAVVDSRFRVIGTKDLRVVDASVFPKIPGFFILTSIYMISEKASDVILEDAERG